MKIISQPIETSPVVPSPLPMEENPAIAQLSENVTALRQTVEALQRAEPKKSEPEPPPELLLQHSRDIAKLTQEVAALRKTLIEFQMPKIVEKVVEVPAATPVPMKHDPSPPPAQTSQPDPAPAAPAVSLPPLHEGKKVAFLTKVWDYLNQTAF